MIELAAHRGCQAVSIAQVTTHAGVSTSTFYELFADKEECALVAYRSAAQRIIDRMQAVDGDASRTSEEWSRSAATALGRLLDAAYVDSAPARLLFVEALSGGPRVSDERTRVMRMFEARAHAFLQSTPPDEPRLDMPPAALMGGVRSIVSRHLRTSAEDQLPALAEDLLAWVRSYAVPPGRTLWSTGPRALLRTRPAPAPRRAPSTPRRLPRGRHGLPASVVARSHRTRIIHAVAEVTLAKGYADTTVKDIVTAAGVSKQVFYEHFSDKQHAFLEAQQHPTQHILDACAAAYFSAGAWPERVWSMLQALLDLAIVNPALTHLRLVECYSAGPAAVRRAEDITRSFTMFLEEGYGARAEASALPRLCSHAITGAVFEILRRHVAGREFEALHSLLPQLTYVSIAPFTGAEEAIGLLQEQIVRERRREGS